MSDESEGREALARRIMRDLEESEPDLKRASALDLVIDQIEDRRASGTELRYDCTSDAFYDALCLARAVMSLIAFGGGNLKLSDERVFKFVRTCDACQNAVPMFTRAGLQSKFCVRCANQLAELEWERQQCPATAPPACDDSSATSGG